MKRFGASLPDGDKHAVRPSHAQWRSIQVKSRDVQIPIKLMALSTRHRHVQIRSWLAALAAAVLLATLATGTPTAAAGAAAASDDPTVISDGTRSP
jgi:hypothetical protein